jgi:NitT/TauT family transport system substrate-binding protein
MMNRERLATAAILALVIVIILTYALRTPPTRATIKVGDVGRSTASSLVYAYGIEKGIYEKYNLNVSSVPFGDIYSIYLSLFTGKIDTTASSPGRISNAYNDGEAVKICMALAESQDLAIVVQPEISTLDDLRGKKIGVMGRATDTYNVLKWYCEAKGFDLEEDFEIVEIKSPVSLVTSFLTGSLDAVGLWAGFEGQVMDGGGKVLLTITDALQETIGEPHYMNIFMVREGLLEDEKVLNNFLKATREIVRRINEDKNEAAEIWADYAGESKDKLLRSLERMKLVGDMNDEIQQDIMAFYEHAAKQGYIESAPGEEIFYREWK